MRSLTAMLVARLTWAGLLLVLPGTLYRVMGGGEAGRLWRVVARILGLRHLAEAVLTRNGGRDRVELAAVVDGIHAASVVGFAVLDRRHRRVALSDAAVAGAFAAWGWQSARTTAPAVP